MTDADPLSPAVAVHRALAVLRLQGFTGVVWVDAAGHATAEGVSDFTLPARLWDARFSNTVAAVGALTIPPCGRAGVRVERGYPQRDRAGRLVALDNGGTSPLE